jgi:transposase
MDEAGQVILEQTLPTTSEAMQQTFGKIPRCLIALETGTHFPWVSRLLTELGHEVIVAHAQKVQLISKSNRKDDRHDARTLARLARIGDLRRWGLKLAERGGKNAKKRAVVAVARKLAVLLHRLWVGGEVYESLRNSQKAMRAVA